MPVVSVGTAGSQIIASAQVSKMLTVSLAEGTTSTITDLGIQVNNLPNAFIWINQTGGAAGASFAPMFAVNNIWSGAASTPNWQKLTPNQALFLSTPAFFNFRVVANMLTISLSTPGFVGTYTFDCIVAASQ
jgi:hypothetical protein